MIGPQPLLDRESLNLIMQLTLKVSTNINFVQYLRSIGWAEFIEVQDCQGIENICYLRSIVQGISFEKLVAPDLI